MWFSVPVLWYFSRYKWILALPYVKFVRCVLLACIIKCDFQYFNTYKITFDAPLRGPRSNTNYQIVMLTHHSLYKPLMSFPMLKIYHIYTLSVFWLWYNEIVLYYKSHTIVMVLDGTVMSITTSKSILASLARRNASWLFQPTIALQAQEPQLRY